MGEIDSLIRIVGMVKDIQRLRAGGRQQAQGSPSSQAGLWAAENAVTGRTIAPPLPVESWFSAPGRFRFGLPRNFTSGDFDRQDWPRRPLAVVADSSTPWGMYLTVFDTHLSVELMHGHTPWVLVADPQGYYRAVQSWGGSVVNGPFPVMIDGERGTWSVIRTAERGQVIDRWTAVTTRHGGCYEVMMGFGDQAGMRQAPYYNDVFATAVGSWHWIDGAEYQSGAKA